MAIPVSLEDAKRQLRYDDAEQLSASRQVEIEGFIADAAAWVEDYTGHILVARDVTETFVGFGRMELRAWPVDAAAVPIVTYADSANQAVPVTAARIDVSRRPARVAPWIGGRWPGVPCQSIASVTVRAGYELDDIVPPNFARAMKVLISGYDADREGGDVFAKAEASAKSLCRSFRARRL